MTMLPVADVYIASLGRSGSTLVANLLTTPPDRLVLVEPLLHAGCGNDRFLDQMARWGWPVGDAERVHCREPLSGKDAAARAASLLAERLAGLARWGVKEVDPAAHLPNFALLRPRRLVILVRDIRDAMLSHAEKFRRDGRVDYGKELFWRLIEGSRVLVELADGQHFDGPRRVVRYEDFVTRADERAALADFLDWPLDGDPDRNLDLYRRDYEIARHRGIVSAVSVGRHARAGDIPEVARVGEMLAGYQRRFGYAC